MINQGVCHVEFIGEKRNACRILVGGKPEGEMPLGTLMRKLKEYIGIWDLIEDTVL